MKLSAEQDITSLEILWCSIDKLWYLKTSEPRGGTSVVAGETKGKGAEGQMLRCVLLLPLLQSVQRFGPAP